MVTSTTVRQKDKGYQAIVRYRLDNTAKWIHYKAKQGFQKKKDAERWGKEQEAELLLNNPVLDDELGNELTLGQAIDIFMNFKKTRVRYNTLNNFNIAFKHLEQHKTLILNKITTLRLQNIIDDVPASMQKRIRALFKFLAEKELMKPLKVSYKKYKKIKEATIIDYDTFQTLINSKIPLQLKVFCIVAYNTGMRKGEIFGLTPDCVFSDKIVVNKQWAKVGDGLFDFTELKNGKSGIREIPINIEVFDALNSLPFNFSEKRYFNVNSDIVFSNHLKKHNITPHDFRHTVASRMVQQNFNLRYIAYILGDTLDTVIKTYVSLNEEMVKQQNKKFCAEFVPYKSKKL